MQANLDEQERQEMILPGETGTIGTHQVQVDPITGTLQTSPGVFPAVQANLDEQARQQMILPGETGTIGTHQVQVDPVTGTLQTGPGVFPAIAAQQQNEGLLSVISGDLDTPLTADDVMGAIARIAVSRNEEAGSGTTADVAGLDAQAERYARTVQDGPRTLEDIKRAFPDLTDEEAKEQLAFQTVLDIYNETQNPNIGSIQLTEEFRRRGLSPGDAAALTKWTIDAGLGGYHDLWSTGGAVVGGFAGAHAGRLIPVFSSPISSRLTTGVLRGGVEEFGEETGEIVADVIHTAVTGGNPVAILLDPKTYAYAGGSILFSSVTEADSPGVRPQAEAVPNGAVGNGAVYSLGSSVDPTVAAEGNRLLDRRAASRQELDKYLNDPRPEGVDPNTWNLRGQALARDVSNADAALTDFRLRNPDLVVGYKSGGTLTVVTATNLIVTLPPVGNAQIHTLPPGEAIFVSSSTETPDANSDASPATSAPVPDRSSPGDQPEPTNLPGVALGVADPVVGATSSAPSGLASPAVPSTTPQVTPSPAPTSAVAPAPTLAPIPTATFVAPLPKGTAVPSPQQQAAPTLTSPQTASPRGRSAPPTVVPPGTPTPGTPTPSPPSPTPAPSTTPQPQSEPRRSLSLSPVRRRRSRPHRTLTPGRGLRLSRVLSRVPSRVPARGRCRRPSPSLARGRCRRPRLRRRCRCRSCNRSHNSNR